MVNKKISIQFDATLETSKMKSAIEDINKSLMQSSVNLPKTISTNLSKVISNISQEIGKLESMTGAAPSPQSAKDISKTYDSIAKKLQNLKVIMSDIGKGVELKPESFFPPEVLDKINQATQAINNYKKEIAQGPNTEVYKQLVKDLNEVNKKVNEYNDKADKAKVSQNIATSTLQDLNQNLASQKAIKEEAEETLKIAQAQIEEGKAQARTLKQIESLERKIAEAKARKEKAQANSDEKEELMSQKKRKDTKIYSQLEASKAKSDAVVKTESELIAKYEQEVKAAEESAKKIEKAEAEKNAALEKSANAQKILKKIEKEIGLQETKVSEKKNEFEEYSKQAKEAAEEAVRLREEQEKLNVAFQKNSFSILKQNLEKIGVEIPETTKNLEQIQIILENLSDEATEKLGESLKEAGVELEKLGLHLKTVGEKKEVFDDIAEAEKRAKEEMDHLKNSILQFFSLTNAVSIFKQTVQSALNTIKELDATMTEAAVVTDFSVGDMWEKLPQYSKEAQRLGVSINDMYQATTLYYQQGLKNNEAMAIGAETMKMGKIAAMDSTEATKAMTSALRGFNMELNETSAVRVNDVYSQLAAVTAADTSQIATAMEKTASIAASANMEFETTAAFLSQIIETTQEAPETAGTALKTIIARFSEVKNLANQGLVSGQDSEGEVIDVNKIQTALRTVGISMDEYFAGTEGLDQVLLRLAEKWGTLNFETQRYIATMAAGSRQQSRFIAMMSDYGRTTELVSAANNSAGASQKQFEKTLDSMKSKLTRLKNAWDQFTMGLANNELLKFGVDLLASVLETINKITSAISGDNGLLKSLVSLIAVISAFKGGKTLLEGITGKIKGEFGLGSYKEIITEEQVDEKTVRTIIKEPYKEGKDAGIKASSGFIAGWQQGISGAKQPNNNFIKGLFQEELFIYEGREEAKEALLQQLNGLSGSGLQEEDIKLLDKLKKELKEGSISAEDAAKKMANLKIELDENSKEALKNIKQSKKFAYTTKSVANGIASVGQAATVAGAGLSVLGQEMSKAGEESGELVQNIGSIVSVAGALVQTAPKIVDYIDKFKQLDAAQQASIGKTSAVALAVTVVVASITMAVSAWNKFNKAKDIDTIIGKLSDQSAKIGTQLQDLRIEMEEIVDKKKGIKELTNGFRKLTKGTAQWNNQLIDTNNAVLEIIEKYPELAQYIKKGSYDQLEIDQAGWEAIEQRQNSQQSLLFDTQAALNIQKNNSMYQKELETSWAEIDKKSIEEIAEQRGENTKEGQEAQVLAGAGIGSATAAVAGLKIGAAAGSTVAPVIGTLVGAVAGALVGAAVGAGVAAIQEGERDVEAAEYQAYGMTQEDFTKFAAASAESGLSWATSTKEDFRAFFEKNGYSGDFETLWSSIDRLGSNFDKLANSSLAVKNANDALTASVIDNIAAQNSNIDESQYKFVAVELGKQRIKNYGENVEKRSSEIEQSMNNEDEREQILSQYTSITGKQITDIEKEIEKGELTEKDIANTVATKEIDGNIKKFFERTIKFTEDLTKGKNIEQQNIIAQAITGSISTTSLSTLTNGPKSAEDWEKLIGKTNKNSEPDDELFKQTGFYFWEDYYKWIDENQRKFNSQIEEAYSKVGGRDQIDTLNEYITSMDGTGFTAEQAINWADILNTVKLQGGKEEQLMNLIPQLTEGLTGEKLDMAINLLSTGLLDTTTNIDSTISALKDLGVSIDQDLIKTLYRATNAVYKFDAAAIDEKFKNLGSLVDTLEGKIEKGENSYSSEEINKLIEAGIVKREDFKRIGYDEFISLQPTEKLLEQIADNTSYLRTGAIGGLSKNVSMGEIIDNAVKDENPKIYIEKYTGQEGNNGYSGDTITVAEAITMLQNGQLDAWGAGGTTNIGDKGLTALAGAIGIGAKQTKGLDQTELIELILNHWNAYYGNDGTVFQKNKKDLETEGKDLYNWHQLDSAGTEDFYNSIYTGFNKNEQFIDSSSGINWIDKELPKWITNAKEAYSYGTGQNAEVGYGLDIDYDLLLEEIQKNPNFASEYLNVPIINTIMRDMVSQLGFTDTETMNSNTLYSILKNTQDIAGAEENIDSLIQAEKGLGYAVDITAQGLKDQASLVADDTLAIKNLVIATQNQNEKMLKAGAALKENSDLLKTGKKNNLEYGAALEHVSKLVSEAFGIDVTEEFVNQHRNLFLQIIEGGEQAVTAYEELTWQAIASANKISLESEEMDKVQQLVNQIISDARTYDGVIDLSSYTQEIEGLGDAANIAKIALESFFATFKNADGKIIATLVDFSSWIKTGDGSSADSWENPYDVFYNTLQRINEASRERERLERRYQKLVEKGAATAENLSQIKKQELATLQAEAQLQNDIITGRKQQISQHIQQEGLEKYVSVTEDEATGYLKIRIDYEEIDSSGNSEIEEAIGKIEEWTESANDANDALMDIEDSVDEIKDRGKDEYLELEQTIKDALVESYQKQIDSLSDINDSINEANSKMIESMQQIISDERQARDNQRAEEEIADKQRRLAYLQQDTSGAHASEIMSLEKEIGDAQENYTDTLIDQKISELQQQNDEAAEQRERQIEIAQNQLDHWVKTGGVWEEVEKLMNEGLDPKEGLIRGERLETILRDSANWEGMSKFEQLDWSKEINANIAEGLSWLRDYETGETDIDLTKGSKNNSDMGNLKTNQPYSTEKSEDPKEPQYNWRVANTQTILKDAKMYDGPIDGIHTEETEQAEKKYRSTYNLADSEDIVSHYQATGYKAVTGKEFPYEDPVFIDPNKRRTGYLPGSTTEFESSFGEDKNGVVWIFGGPNDTGALGTIWHNGKRIPINHYQTGGLADYTGPAWLDGTKSKPELVLNAQDTQNFIQLKNILASLKFGKVLEAEKNGDSVYDIDINVETIQNKEDLDMISKYIEDKIISSANYRNNNLIKINR